MTNEQILEGHWTELKGHIRRKWGELTDDDLMRARGSIEQLVGLIQEKTGEARARVERELDELIRNQASVVTRVADNLRDVADHASDRAKEGYQQVSQKVRDGYVSAEKTVQQRPLESVAVAFGTGLIAGVIVGLVARSK